MKTCDVFLTAGNKARMRVGKKGVGVEVGGNNCNSEGFEETSNDPRCVMESEGLITVSNYQT